MTPRRSARPSPRRAAAALAGGLLVAVAIQAGLYAALENRPGLRDPEYGRRSANLRKLIAAEPARPVALVLGSSRVALGVRVVEVAERPGDPLVFNFGVLGGGPRMQALYLRRLLDEGVRPARVYAEFWPPFADAGEAVRFSAERFNRRDVSRMRAYNPDSDTLPRRWVEARAVPAYSSRFLLMSQFAPDWLPWACRKDGTWGNIDPRGWSRHGDPRPEGRPARVESARQYFQAGLADAPVEPGADKAIHDLIALCRAEGVPVTLLLMPESSELRSWYGSPTKCRFDAWLADLRTRAGVPVLDGRDWNGDADLMDAVHLTPDGATAFTRRFVEAVRADFGGDR